MTRQMLPPIAGSIQTTIGVVRFQFVASGSSMPAVVLTNHGLTADFQYGGREVRFRFLIAPAGPNGRWQRTDAAEPDCDFMDGPDAVPDSVCTAVHDGCLDAWEIYMDQRSDLIDYARLVQINNDIVLLDEKIVRLNGQLTVAVGRRDNLVDLESRIRKKLPQDSPELSEVERHILNQMVNFNCWLTTQDGQHAELHAFQSASTLEAVDSAAANRLATCGFIQLHRNLGDGRTAWKVADRGREIVEGKA